MLTDKVYIVAGGGHGLGEATAIELGRHGATVVVNDLGTDEHGEETSEAPAEETAAAVRDEGGTAQAHYGDVSSAAYTDELVADTVDEFGAIDGAVNFAGILRDSLLHEMTDDEWNAVYRVHLRGHFCLLRSLARQWIEGPHDPEANDQRAFVSVSSESALGNIGQANYSAAKSGILGLTRTAARELHRHDVRVNAIMPRAFTRLVETLPEKHQPDEDDMPDPSDVAPIVAYLLGDGPEDVTGCTFVVAGERFNVVSDPQVTTSAYSKGGWSFEDLTAEFHSVMEGEELTRTGHQI